jgi:hypothetical protein
MTSTCDWCGEPGDDGKGDEAMGPINEDGMHLGCSRSEKEGAMATHLRRLDDAAPDAAAAEVADRAETDPCERGTVGCCIAHKSDGVEPCATW